jgi:hypothetical protein
MTTVYSCQAFIVVKALSSVALGFAFAFALVRALARVVPKAIAIVVLFAKAIEVAILVLVNHLVCLRNECCHSRTSTL